MRNVEESKLIFLYLISSTLTKNTIFKDTKIRDHISEILRLSLFHLLSDINIISLKWTIFFPALLFCTVRVPGYWGFYFCLCIVVRDPAHDIHAPTPMLCKLSQHGRIKVLPFFSVLIYELCRCGKMKVLPFFSVLIYELCRCGKMKVLPFFVVL